MSVYVIADLHFGDDLIRKCERPQFKNVLDMNNVLQSAWNSVVSDDDLVYVLGDFAKQGTSFEVVKTLVSSLKGRKRLVIGNHDDLSVEEYRQAGFEMIYDMPVLLDGFWLLSHEPLYVTESMPYANIFGHVHTNPNYKDASSRGACVSAERLGLTPALMSEIKRAVHEAN